GTGGSNSSFGRWQRVGRWSELFHHVIAREAGRLAVDCRLDIAKDERFVSKWSDPSATPPRSLKHPYASNRGTSFALLVSIGRGGAALLAAARQLYGTRRRRVIVKARIVRHGFHSASAVRTHLCYLRREGVTKDGAAARMFDTVSDDADLQTFAERARDDRHHFRFILSPEDATEMADLRAFTRDL